MLHISGVVDHAVDIGRRPVVAWGCARDVEEDPHESIEGALGLALQGERTYSRPFRRFHSTLFRSRAHRHLAKLIPYRATTTPWSPW